MLTTKSAETRHVLIVDDSTDNQFFMKAVLKRWGMTCACASDGEEAIRLALEGDFDTILMDTQMPLVDGNEATERLRRAGYTGRIIAISAHSLAAEKLKALTAGCDDYLEKPVDKVRLLQIISGCSQAVS